MEIDEIKIPEGTESIVLLAAEHRDDVSPTSLYYDVNVQGTKNVLQAMDKAGVKNLIFTSSLLLYVFLSKVKGFNLMSLLID